MRLISTLAALLILTTLCACSANHDQYNDAFVGTYGSCSPEAGYVVILHEVTIRSDEAISRCMTIDDAKHTADQLNEIMKGKWSLQHSTQ